MERVDKTVLAVAACAAVSIAAATDLGVCAHVCSHGEFEIHEKEFEMMQAAGIKRVRADFHWAQIEPAAGEWDFKMTDIVVGDAEKHGLRMLPIFCYDNAKVYPDYAWQHPGEWCRFVKKTVERYRKHFDVVEVWNEPNISFWKPLPDAKQYTEFLRATYAAVKSVAPEIKVMMGGTAGCDLGFIEAAYKCGLKDCTDILNIHPYSWPNPPDGLLDVKIGKLRELAAKYGDAGKEIWITEHGWPTHKEQVQDPYIFLAGMKLARPERRTWRVRYAKLSDNGPGEVQAALIGKILPEGSECIALPPKRLAEELASGGVDAVIFPPNECFPLDAIDAVREFVAKGGVLFAIGNFPIYYAVRDGKTVEGVDCDAVRRGFHIGLDAWWMNKNLPEAMQAFPTEEAKANGYKADPAGWRVGRFFTAKNLKEGDRMIPILQGTDGAGKPAIAAAVYKLDSDMKGAVILSAYGSGGANGTSEDDQAKHLVRSFEISRELGVGAYFPYEFQAFEGDPYYSEAHFGIVHGDLTPKPAYKALERLMNKRKE